MARILTAEMVIENHRFGHGKSWKSHGIAFPRFRGKPVQLALVSQLDQVLKMIERIVEKCRRLRGTFGRFFNFWPFCNNYFTKMNNLSLEWQRKIYDTVMQNLALMSALKCCDGCSEFQNPIFWSTNYTSVCYCNGFNALVVSSLFEEIRMLEHPQCDFVICFMKKKCQENLCFGQLDIFLSWIYSVLCDKLTDQRFNFNFSTLQKS